MWFKKYQKQKWHLACYGGSLAYCGRDVHIAACYASFRELETTVDDVVGSPKYCQSCVNAIMRGRVYIKQLEDDYEIRQALKRGGYQMDRIAKIYRDFCPLCGSRFQGNSPDEVYEQIIKHVEDKTCENNFRPLAEALADTGKDSATHCTM